MLAFFLCLFMPQAVRADCATVTMGNKPTGYVFHNADYNVLQVCRADGNWMALGPVGSYSPPDPCAGSPSPGDVCADGTIYAGLSPDGNVSMYTTAADESSGTYWNNGTSTSYTTTSQTSWSTGEANTTALIGLDSDGWTAGTQPHQAAQLCADLTANGHSDWYLPAKDELNVLYTNEAAIGGFDVSGSFPAGYYWSSSENTAFNAWTQRFSAGTQNVVNKDSVLPVRCVRR